MFDRAPGPDGGEQVAVNNLTVDFDELAGVFSTSSVQANRQLNETVGGMNLMAGSANSLTEFDLRVWVETWVEPALRQCVRLDPVLRDRRGHHRDRRRERRADRASRAAQAAARAAAGATDARGRRRSRKCRWAGAGEPAQGQGPHPRQRRHRRARFEAEARKVHGRRRHHDEDAAGARRGRRDAERAGDDERGMGPARLQGRRPLLQGQARPVGQATAARGHEGADRRREGEGRTSKIEDRSRQGAGGPPVRGPGPRGSKSGEDRHAGRRGERQAAGGRAARRCHVGAAGGGGQPAGSAGPGGRPAAGQDQRHADADARRQSPRGSNRWRKPSTPWPRPRPHRRRSPPRKGALSQRGSAK